MSLLFANRLGVIALACLAGACGNDGDQSGANGGGGPYMLERDGSKVEPTTIYRECERDSDCTLVNVTCDGCCTRDAIASSLEGQFESARSAACDDYVGPVCRCQNVELAATCKAGRCTAVPAAADPCVQLEGTYRSINNLECGLAPDGVAHCNWLLTFRAGTFDWQHSDVAESGRYDCKQGVITANADGGLVYEGAITNEGTLTFEGEAYERTP